MLRHSRLHSALPLRARGAGVSQPVGDSSRNLGGKAWTCEKEERKEEDAGKTGTKYCSARSV